MAERRVAQVVSQGDRLNQIFIEPQASPHGAPQLGHFQGMCEPRAKQIPLMVHEDLSLVDQTTKRRAVDDAIAVALILAAGRRCRFRMPPATTVRRVAGVRGEWHGALNS